MESTESSRQVRARGIRAARAAARLNQEDIARLTGLDQTTVSKAEDGRASETTYDLIEDALGMAS